jgi:hypothetical protein
VFVVGWGGGGVVRRINERRRQMERERDRGWGGGKRRSHQKRIPMARAKPSRRA